MLDLHSERPLVFLQLVQITSMPALIIPWACANSDSKTGELRVKGPGVFKEYLNKAEATKEAFDSEGWFR